MVTAYPSYRHSGFGWLGKIPSHWKIGRLKFSANARTSNVDKHIKDDETPVQLCNYVDVYKNESITSELKFMQASATPAEVERFKIKKGDVLITKDSESWDDIAVPAMVSENLDDVLCGYHLAIIRSLPGEFHTGYLFRLLSSDLLNYQFKIEANGVTRFGLPTSAIDNALLLRPPLEEQEIISDYVDRATTQIDALIDKKRCLLELLVEKRLAVITNAITKGLDPDVPVKDSGVEWLGQIPAHWEVKAMRFAMEFLNHRRIPLNAVDRSGLDRLYPYYGASGIIDYVDDYLFEEPLILIAEDGANLLSRSTPLAFVASGRYWVNNHAHILRPRGGEFDYWAHLLCTIDYTPWISGAAQPKLTLGRLASIRLPCPPAEEQSRITVQLRSELAPAGRLEAIIRRSINEQLEYRSALITNAVTGKIDVRGAAEKEAAA